MLNNWQRYCCCRDQINFIFIMCVTLEGIRPYLVNGWILTSSSKQETDYKQTKLFEE